MIIAISDLHLGDPLSNQKGFSKFINEFLKPNSKEITHLVILGDFFDFWGRNITVLIRDHSDIFDALSNLDCELHYIVGNHDYALYDSDLLFRDDVVVEKSLSLTNEGSKFRFIHGHQMSYWYALSFYEQFSHSMCYVTEEDDISVVWKIFQDNSESSSTLLVERVDSLLHEKRRQIENKLAGPLMGLSSSIEDSYLLEHKLLESFVDFSYIKAETTDSLLGEVNSLSKKILDLTEGVVPPLVIQDSSPENTAKSFLRFWKDTFQWTKRNGGAERLGDNLGQIKRITSMLSVDLQKDEFLIHGHGHNGAVDFENRMADAGCWIGNLGSYVAVSDGQVFCVRWPKG